MFPWLEWGLLAVSLVNVILLCWLGLTVWLNAARRDWGVWVAGGSMLIGAALYLFHAVFMSVGTPSISPILVARWPVAWAAGFGLPCAWYVVMLWYSGYWENRAAMRYHRLHSGALAALSAVIIVVSLAIIVTHLPLTQPYEITFILYGPTFHTVPWVAIIYGLAILLCNAMSLLALACPAPSSRIMQNLARGRARPWLSATSLSLLVVSLLVCAALVIFTPTLYTLTLAKLPVSLQHDISRFDLLISTMVMVSVLLLGQGMVVYEIFTEKPLPRRGLRRGWLRIVMLAVGYSGMIAVSLVVRMPPIYGVLLAAVAFGVFYAHINWRIFTEHEQYLRRLRSFVVGPPVFETLLNAPAPDVGTLLRTLCEELLGTQRAYLIPLGPFAPILEPFAHPAGPAPPVAYLAAAWRQQELFYPLDPEEFAGARWVIPLWSARGLVGALLLGDRRDGGLYTQEEMEIARAAGEHLLDTAASLSMAHRLLQLQRARLAESQLVDRRTRRTLHDDILPQLHTAMLALSAGPEQAPEVLAQLADTHRAISDVLHALPATHFSAGQIASLADFRAAIEREFAGHFDSLTWQAAPDVNRSFSILSPLATEVLVGAAREAVRNAARHGRGADADRPLNLRVTLATAQGLITVIEDDGVGMHNAATRAEGAGQGIALHSAMLAILGGAWQAESNNPGTRITLSLPPAGNLTAEHENVM